MGGELAVGGAEGVLGRVLAWLDVANHVRREMFCYDETGQDTTKYAFCATGGQLAAHGFVDAVAAYAWVCCCSGAGLRRILEKNYEPKPASRARNSKRLGALPTRPRQNITVHDRVFIHIYRYVPPWQQPGWFFRGRPGKTVGRGGAGAPNANPLLLLPDRLARVASCRWVEGVGGGEEVGVGRSFRRSTAASALVELNSAAIEASAATEAHDTSAPSATLMARAKPALPSAPKHEAPD